jgi:hypothetical protein
MMDCRLQAGPKQVECGDTPAKPPMKTRNRRHHDTHAVELPDRWKLHMEMTFNKSIINTPPPFAAHRRTSSSQAFQTFQNPAVSPEILFV